ncbi:MAG: bifunctional DNA primase/polymerase [Thermoleophilaceae bacterium]|nr:bifunctional DNA primase/polymerase [Thermoleophilaceae bacterium]
MNNLHQQRAATARWSPRLLSDIVDAPDLATAAEHLGTRGIPVFPCLPGGKSPLTTHGFQDASADPDAINLWWRRQPDANIGVPTGGAGGIDVVDVDVHQTGSGFAAFEHARQAGFVEGWAWLVRTPSGGLHAYFLRVSETEQRSWQLPSRHIDFRGDGGYIIVPPSQVTGEDGVTGTYQRIAVAEHHRPSPVDAAGLRGFLDPPRPTRPPTDMPVVGARPDKLAAWVASRPEGGRNGGLFWAACRMAEDGHDLSATVSLLGEAAYGAGLSEREAMATIRSAYRIATRLGPATQPRRTSAVEAVGL